MVDQQRRAAGACAALLLLLLAAGAAEAAQRDPWQVLGVRRSATQREITKAFRKLSREWHPDKNKSPGATEKFQEISAAYDYLTDPARQTKPWDFQPGAGGSTAGGAGRPGGTTINFDVFEDSYQFVLDLDPMRTWALFTDWVHAKLEKHWEIMGPLWRGPVDASLCACLEASWQLPRLLEPALLFGAEHMPQAFPYKPGQWRTWRSSGVLLELSFWVARQAPCLRHHTLSAEPEDDDGEPRRPTDKELLLEVQQALHSQRRMREQLLMAERGDGDAARGRGDGGRAARDGGGEEEAGSEVVPDGGAALDPRRLVPRALPGRLLWLSLAAAAGALMRRNRLLIFVGVALAAGGLWAVFAAKAPGAVAGLAAALEANSLRGWLAGSWYVAGTLSLCVLLPFLVAGGLGLSVTWVWAVVSCASIAITPCLSRTGFAVWILVQLWGQMVGLLRSLLVLAALAAAVYARPALALWWAGLLISPASFGYHLARVLLRAGLACVGLACPIEHPSPARPARNADGDATAPAAAAAAAAARRQGGQAPGKGAAARGAAGAGTPGASGAAGAGAERPRSSVWLFSGPWWPRTFGPADLAIACHWWMGLLGWTLPARAATAAAIAAKLTAGVALAALAGASFGVPVGWLTVQRLVHVVALRLGLALGLGWAALVSLEDVAAALDPAGYEKRARRRARLQRLLQRRGGGGGGGAPAAVAAKKNE
ncbi:ERDJ3A [Scenedesmus sp. PABB004]|nr:ERDJ3A [Scenedesmus sp. PABB004]